jgi:hypothetical protein
MQGLLPAGDAVPAQHARDGRDVTGDAQAVVQFCEGSVGVFADQGEESPDGDRIELGGGAAAVGLGLDGPGRTPSLQEPDEEGEIDGEEAGNLAERVFTAINGRDDARAEIVGVRTHEDTSLGCPPSHSIPYVSHVRAAQGGKGGEALVVGRAIKAGNALVLAEVDGQNEAGGRGGGGGSRHGKLLGGKWEWETVNTLGVPLPPRLAWILSAG